MFGIAFITSTEYESLVSAKETLGDRVRLLESKLSNADNALKTVEKNLQSILAESEQCKSALISTREFNANQIEELQEKIERSHKTNERLEQDLDQSLESIANLQKTLSEVKRQLADSKSWTKQLEEQNQNHIDTIAKFVSQCDEAERERNELIVEKGLLKASLGSCHQSVAIAVDNLNLEIKNIFGVKV